MSYNDDIFSEFMNVQKRIRNSEFSNEKSKFQKEKFRILCSLVRDLFKNKNDIEHYNNISNMIITSLTSLEDKMPVDIYHGESIIENDYKPILISELDTEIGDYVKLLSVGRNFVDVVERFTEQYDRVENVFIKSPHSLGLNGIPN